MFQHNFCDLCKFFSEQYITVFYSIIQVQFKGCLSYKMYMPLKLAKFGIKIWARCNDNGYLQQFKIYLGNKETKVSPNVLHFDIVD